MTTQPESHRIFDRALLRRRRERLASQPADGGGDFLFVEAADRLLDRLDDVTHRFPVALDLGSRNGVIARRLAGRGGIQHLIQGDLSIGLLRRAEGAYPLVQMDEEMLPFGAESLDLVLSNLALHWTNDLPGTLAQVRYALRPDGLFLACLFGVGTLNELQASLMEAEIAETGGASARVAPFADLRDAAGLLQRVGFSLPVADLETITVTYDDMHGLLADLRQMGEANLLLKRLKRPTRRSVFARAADIYRQKFATADGRIAATFNLIFLTGWAPHESQQQPARRGSGKTSLATALGSRLGRPDGDAAD